MEMGVQLSGSFHYGSGQAFQVSGGSNPFGATVTANRLIATTAKTYIDPQFIKPSNLPGYNIIDRDFYYGHSIQRVDLRLSKTFTVKERLRFVPIIEAFNLFNHSNFGTYNVSATTASFGTPAQNSDLAFAPRMLQFAGRFEF